MCAYMQTCICIHTQYTHQSQLWAPSQSFSIDMRTLLQTRFNHSESSDPKRDTLLHQLEPQLELLELSCAHVRATTLNTLFELPIIRRHQNCAARSKSDPKGVLLAPKVLQKRTLLRGQRHNFQQERMLFHHV